MRRAGDDVVVTSVVRGGGRAPGAGLADLCARPTLRHEITMRCYGCGGRRRYVVVVGSLTFMGLGRPCPVCGGVRTAESVRAAAPLMLIEDKR